MAEIIRGATLFIVVALLIATPFIVLGRNWRRSIILLFLWLPLEGLARRLLPELQLPLIFVKDYILICIYLRFIILSPVHMNPLARRLLVAPLMALIVITTVQLLNPHLPGIVVGLLGLKSLFFYIPLIIVGYAMMRDEESILKFFRLLMWTAIPLTFIAGIQLLVPDFQFTDADFTTSVTIRATNLVGGLALPTSTYTGLGRYANYMMFLTFIGLGILGSTRGGGKFMMIGLVVAVVGLAISGRRTPLFLTVVLIVALIATPFALSLFSRARMPAFRVTSLFLMALAGLSVVIFVGFTLLPDHLSRLSSFYTFTFTGDIQEQLIGRLQGEVIGATVHVWREIGPFGLGTGTYAQGVESFLNIKDMPTIPSDGLIPKVLAELGLIGLLIFGWFALTLSWVSWKSALELRPNRWYFFGLTVFFYQIAFFMTAVKGYSQFLDAFQQIYFWLTTGILYGLMRTLGESPTSPVAVPLRKARAVANTN